MNDFRTSWIQQISTHQKGFIPIEEVEKHKEWFEYLFNDKDPVKSTYRCRLCYKYYDNFGLQKRYKSGFAEEKGTLRTRKNDNKQHIAEHAKTPGHAAIVQTLQAQAAKRYI